MAQRTEISWKHEFECDRCAGTFHCYPEELLRLGLGCDCGGAWIDVTPPNLEPVLGEPESDFPSLWADRA